MRGESVTWHKAHRVATHAATTAYGHAADGQPHRAQTVHEGALHHATHKSRHVKAHTVAAYRHALHRVEDEVYT